MKIIHPGMLLHEEVLIPKDISIKEAAEMLHVNEDYLKDVCCGRKPICEALSVELSMAFNCSKDFWINMQNNYDKTITNE